MNEDAKINRPPGPILGDDLVSVIIPTYYRDEDLEKAIRSAMDQSYSPIEVIVIDDSGERYAERIVEGYDVMYIAHDENEGAQAARNTGISNSTGRYINLLDDDDQLRRDKIARQVSKIQTIDDVGVVYCGKELETGRKVLPHRNKRGDVLKHALRFQMTPCSPSTMLIENEVLEQIFPLADRPAADDIGMKIELAQIAKFDFVDEPLVIQSVGRDTRGNSMNAVVGRKQILDEYNELYDEYPSSVYRTALAHTYLLESDTILNDHRWSYKAFMAAALALLYIPGIRVTFLGYFLASLFGQPGRAIAWRFYSSYIVGDEHRGGLT